MKISEKLQNSLNAQLSRELQASHNYLGMAAYFENLNLEGFASWMKHQSVEEREHALKFFGYVNERLGKAQLGAIQDAQTEFSSPLQAFESAFSQEQKVTEHINSLYAQAQKEEDFATCDFLNWFLKEQVEEEDSTDKIVQKLKVIGENKSALLFLDSQLAKRE